MRDYSITCNRYNLYNPDISHDADLFNAVENKDIKKLKLLIENGANVNISKKGGVSLLLTAVFSKKIEIIDLLIDSKANVNAIDDRKATPLFAALHPWPNEEVIKLLCISRANININVANKPLLDWAEQDMKEKIKVWSQLPVQVDKEIKLVLKDILQAVSIFNCNFFPDNDERNNERAKANPFWANNFDMVIYIYKFLNSLNVICEKTLNSLLKIKLENFNKEFFELLLQSKEQKTHVYEELKRRVNYSENIKECEFNLFE